MNKYVGTIILISIIGALISTIISGVESGMKKHMALILGLVYTIVFITPIVSFASNTTVLKDNLTNILENITSNDSIYNKNQLIVKTSVENINNGIKEALVSKFDFKESDVDINIIVDDSNIESILIKKVQIVLSGEASWYSENKIREYLQDLVGCEINIIRR